LRTRFFSPPAWRTVFRPTTPVGSTDPSADPRTPRDAGRHRRPRVPSSSPERARRGSARAHAPPGSRAGRRAFRARRVGSSTPPRRWRAHAASPRPPVAAPASPRRSPRGRDPSQDVHDGQGQGELLRGHRVQIGEGASSVPRDPAPAPAPSPRRAMMSSRLPVSFISAPPSHPRPGPLTVSPPLPRSPRSS